MPAAWSTMHDMGAIAVTHSRRRQERRGFEVIGRRRSRRRAAPGQAVRRVRARRRVSAAGAGDLPRLRAARREEESQPRAHQVSGRQAGHRGVPRAGAAKSAQMLPHDPRWTDYLDVGDEHYGEPLQAVPMLQRHRAARRVRAWYANQRLRAESRPATSSPRSTLPLGDITSRQLRALADIARQFVKETRSHDGRAEHRAALGEPKPTFRALQGDSKPSAWAPPARQRSSTSPLPRHRHLQAGHRLLARPGRANCACGSARRTCELDEAVSEPAHQGQRLLQLLRPASHRRHRLLRHQPQR